jgi:hypothetical protein
MSKRKPSRQTSTEGVDVTSESSGTADVQPGEPKKTIGQRAKERYERLREFSVSEWVEQNQGAVSEAGQALVNAGNPDPRIRDACLLLGYIQAQLHTHPDGDFALTDRSWASIQARIAYLLTAVDYSRRCLAEGVREGRKVLSPEKAQEKKVKLEAKLAKLNAQLAKLQGSEDPA